MTNRFVAIVCNVLSFYKKKRKIYVMHTIDPNIVTRRKIEVGTTTTITTITDNVSKYFQIFLR